MVEIGEGRERQVRIRIGSGARDTEEALLEDLDERFTLAAGRPPRPLLVIVPSRSLRQHLLATVARRHGSVLGLSCQTLRSLAQTILERVGEPVPSGGDLLFELFSRRFARRERRLAEPLGGLRDGFATVATTVRDLLDAGFDPAHSEALDEALASEGRQVATPEATERAQALVRIAHETALGLDAHGSGGPSEVLRLAVEVLRAEVPPVAGEPAGSLLVDADRALPPGEVFIHGFADATGLATDLLQTVLERRGGTVYLDHPPDPASPASAPATDSALIFGRRFRERLQALAKPEAARNPSPPPRIDRFRALGESAEVRAVAERIMPLLDSGARAERIAIVARDLGPYRSPLRIHLGRLGIPFSGHGQAGPPHPSTRRIEGLLELVEQRDGITLESWIDILTERFDGATLTDLRLAMAAGGWRRLRDLLSGGRTIHATRLRLPVFEGLVTDESGATRPVRRALDPDALKRLLGVAVATVAQLSAWPVEGPLADHLAAVESLLIDALGWDPEEAIARRLLDALGEIRNLAEISVSREEFRLLLRRTLESDDRLGDACLAGTRLGGRGAGVQILNAVEARGRTFSHLFLLGMNRGRFPRTIREDPILPDDLRQVLGRDGHGVLPDLGTKRSGHFEERFLFSQLLSASPHVTLSWLEVADDDSRKSPSPLVERLRWSADGQTGRGPGSQAVGSATSVGLPDSLQAPIGVHESAGVKQSAGAPEPDEIPLARPILAIDLPPVGGTGVGALAGDSSSAATWRVRTAYEAAIVAGVTDRRQLLKLLPLALEEAWQDTSSTSLSATSVAAARMAVLGEWDPIQTDRASRRQAPGPYLGLIGRPLDNGDPRRANPLFVTVLEGLARCPWQTFLGRVLRLEPLPDPLDGPPRLEAGHTGSLVHRFLQSLVDDADGGATGVTLEEFAASEAEEPSPLAWPNAAAIDSRLRRFAEQLLHRKGIDYPGMALVLTAAAHRHIDVARLLDSRESKAPSAFAAEIYGAITLGDDEPSGRRLHFKADRAELFDDGLRLTDFKTGKPPSTAAKATSRHKALLAGLATGQLLQAAAYARAASEALASSDLKATDQAPMADGRTGPAGTPTTGRYLHLSPDLDPEILEFPVTADDAQLFELFDTVTGTLLAQWEAGVLFPRLEQHGTETEPRTCGFCDVKEACARGDSGVRRRLRQWIAEQEDTASPTSKDRIDELFVAAWRLSTKWVAPK